jgi:S-adenosylmethionine synthetase
MSRKGRYLFTSESVTEGHPDKIADQISDSILDAILAQDPTSRVACETLITTGPLPRRRRDHHNAYVDVQKLVRETIRGVGYTDSEHGFDCDTCGVISSIHGQSPDIAMGVDTGGAGDQGLMFGYACRETPELMPLPIMLSHRLCEGLSQARRNGVLTYLRPDGKAQVSVEYDGDKPIRVDTVVVSSQHSDEVSTEKLRADITEHIVKKVVPASLMDAKTRILINPPAASWSAARTATPASPAARSSSTPTAARPRTAAARSRARIRRRSTARPCYMARYIAKNVVAG